MRRAVVAVLLCALSVADVLIVGAQTAPQCDSLGIGVTQMSFLGTRFAIEPTYSTTVAFLCTVDDFTIAKHLYRSDDGGKNWTLQMLPNDVLISGNYKGPVSIVSTSNPDIWYFPGYNGALWKTTDGGLHYTYQNVTAPAGNGVLDFYYSPFAVHPSNPDWLLVSYFPGTAPWCPNCPASDGRDLLAAVSTNGGQTWLCAGEIYQFDWVDAAGLWAHFFALRYDPNTGLLNCLVLDALSIVTPSPSSPDCPTNAFPVQGRTTVESCTGFVHYPEFSQLWIGNTTGRRDCLALWFSSDDGVTISHPAMPPHGIINSNTWILVLDSVDGTPFISTRSASAGPEAWGDTFSTVQTASGNNDYFSFVLGSNTNNLTMSVPGMPGVLIANVITTLAPPTQQSLRTTSKGSAWQPMTNRANPSEAIQIFPPGFTSLFPYAVDTAPGMVWAVANVGNHVDRRYPSTWFSNDGGATWSQIAQGEWIFEMADSGTLQIAAPWGYSAATLDPNNLLTFSLDGGRTPFRLCALGNESNVSLRNIVTHRVMQTQGFLVLYDSNAGARAAYLDFSPLRTDGVCHSQNITAVLNPPLCLGGQGFNFYRPNNGNCTLVGASPPPEPSGAPLPCDCKATDFICGWCYRPQYVQSVPSDSPSNICVSIPNCSQVGTACNLPYSGYRLYNDNECTLQPSSPDLWPANCAPLGSTLPCPQSPTFTASSSSSPTKNPSQTPSLTVGVSHTPSGSVGAPLTPSATRGFSGAKGGSDGLSGGAIAGIVIGVLAIVCLGCFALALVVFAVILFVSRLSSAATSSTSDGDYGQQIDDAPSGRDAPSDRDF